MKIKIFFYLLFILQFSNILAMEESMTIILEYGDNENINKTLDTKNVSNEGLGAASKLLLATLYQGEDTILTTTPLWKNILDHKNIFEDALSLNPTSFYNKYSQYKNFQSSSKTYNFEENCKYANEIYETLTMHISCSNSINEFEQLTFKDKKLEKKYTPIHYKKNQEEITNYLLCAKVPINKYIIKKITPSGKFLLFIPKNKFSNLNLQLNLEKCQAINNIFNVMAPEYSTKLKKDYNNSFNKIISQIFNKKTTSKWNIHLLGHGVYSKTTEEKIAQQEDNKTKFKNKIGNLIEEKSKWQNKVEEYREQIKQSHQKNINPKFIENLHKNKNIAKKNIEICRSNLKICQQNIEICGKNIENLEYENIVAGLTRKNFTQFLKLLNQKVNIETLFYASCFAGERNYTDIFYDRSLKLSYNVMTCQLENKPTKLLSSTMSFGPLIDTEKNIKYKPSPENIDLKNHCLIPIKCSYKTFCIAYQGK